MNFRFKPIEIGVFNTSPDKAICLNDGECSIALTYGEYSLIDIIHSVLKKTGKANIAIATWSAGIKDAHQVKWMIEKDMIGEFMILTDHSYKTRQKKYAASLEELFGIDCIRTSEIHAKFVIIKNENFAISIISSMNLNANKTCELFQVIVSQEVYNFLYDFCKAHFDYQQPGFISEFSTISDTLSKYFGTKIELSKHWSDE